MALKVSYGEPTGCQIPQGFLAQQMVTVGSALPGHHRPLRPNVPQPRQDPSGKMSVREHSCTQYDNQDKYIEREQCKHTRTNWYIKIYTAARSSNARQKTNSSHTSSGQQCPGNITVKMQTISKIITVIGPYMQVPENDTQAGPVRWVVTVITRCTQALATDSKCIPISKITTATAYYIQP